MRRKFPRDESESFSKNRTGTRATSNSYEPVHILQWAKIQSKECQHLTNTSQHGKCQFRIRLLYLRRDESILPGNSNSIDKCDLRKHGLILFKQSITIQIYIDGQPTGQSPDWQRQQDFSITRYRSGTQYNEWKIAAYFKSSHDFGSQATADSQLLTLDFWLLLSTFDFWLLTSDTWLLTLDFWCLTPVFLLHSTQFIHCYVWISHSQRILP